MAQRYRNCCLIYSTRAYPLCGKVVPKLATDAKFTRLDGYKRLFGTQKEPEGLLYTGIIWGNMQDIWATMADFIPPSQLLNKLT